MSIIQAAGSGEVSTGFYSHLLDQSIKFNEGDSSYLRRDIVSAGDRTKSTFSCWFKLSGLSGSNDWSQTFYNQGNNSGAYHYIIGMYNNAIYVNDYDYGSSGSPGSAVILQTNRLFRDTSAWYHLVVRVDTTQATAADRVRVYINGVQETSFATQTINISQSANMYVMNHTVSANGSTSIKPVRIGNYIANYNDGYMAEINYCDGQSLGPDSFGVTKNGIWTPIDTSGLTFGTNGFHLTFKDDVVSEGFNTVTYTGTGSTQQSISGIGFSPDLVWLKSRNATRSNGLFDSVRGATKGLASEATSSENTASTGRDLVSFDGDGFTVGNPENFGSANTSGDDIVAWCWEAGGTPTADNSAGAGATPTAGSVKIDGSNLGSALAGTIAATRISANTARGFSIVTYTGTGSNGATVAHGLGAAPTLIFIKARVATSADGNWLVYAKVGNVDETDYLLLNNSASFTDEAGAFNDTAATSTVFSLGTFADLNQSGKTYVAYCWTPITGYSAIGSFTGNGGSQAIDVGFTPAFVMLRRTGGSTWGVFDNTRQSRNLQMLAWNSNAVETTNSQMNFSGNTFNDNGYLSDNGEVVIYMAFADTREAAFFKDVSSNGNHFTPVNLDYRDSVPDVPTNNFVTLNPLYAFQSGGTNYFSPTLSEGNLRADYSSTSGALFAASTIFVDSGKWYVEVKSIAGFGWVGFSHFTNSSTSAGYALILEDGSKNYNGTTGSAVDSVSDGDIIGIAADFDSGTVEFFINNASQTQRDISSFVGVGKFFAFGAYISGSDNLVHFNFGQDSSFAGLHATANSNADGNGHGSFAYAPPSGFLALCSQNLSDPAITDGTENFNTVLYTGNATGSRAITGVGFSPDFVWAKVRSTTYPHFLANSVVGSTKYLKSNSTDAEATDSTYFTSFDSDGFTIGSSGGINGNGETFVAWNWLAGTAFSNDASATGVGTIDSEGQINTTAGFSIIKYTSPNNSSDQTVAHGLSSVPEMIITKNRTSTFNWDIYHKDTGSVQNTLIFTDAATRDYDIFTTTAPTSTVFGIKYNYTHYSTNEYIAYCFHSVEGYCKVGSYVGNGNADGTFVHTGFRPAWIMIKNISGTGGWEIHDNKRVGYNPADETLDANTTAAEATGNNLDILSNGFKVRHTYGTANTSGSTYVYLAFADQPFKFSNAR